MTLSEIYNGDRFLKDGVCRMLRENVRIPHPLRGVEYRDGEYRGEEK
jgi:hypothetical protein